MKGNVLDFLKLVDEKPQLAQELVDLAARYDFEFSDAVTDEELEKIAGGMSGGVPIPTVYTNLGSISPSKVTVSDKSVSDPSDIPASSGDEAGTQSGTSSITPAPSPPSKKTASTTVRFDV